MPAISRSPIPVPLAYQRALVGYLRTEEAGLWQWFAARTQRSDEADAVRLDLLKSTYRLEPESQPNLHALAHELRERMAIASSITLYQAQTGPAMNAALAYLPGEAHLILAGPLLAVLSEQELRAVLAHELAHFLLFEQWQGEYLIAAELVRALSQDPTAAPAYLESARLYNLWTEVYADRWACHVSADLSVAVSTLVKIETGLEEVSAESYLRQAEEIFSKGRAPTNNLTHPELYIRARALQLWAEQGDDAQAEIERMIEGPLHLDRLDLLGQKKAALLTRRFLALLLAPAWFRTEAVLAHARRFFADFIPGTADEPALKEELDAGTPSLHDYFSYLLLDFVTADRDLGDVALALALVVARPLGLEERFTALAQKELGLGKKAFAKIEKEAETLVAQAAAGQP
jgi:Zn-dependent protease with chaperone function